MAPALVSINLAVVTDNPAHRHRPGRANTGARTGIDKRSADHPVRLEALGVVGDSVCDTRHHGGLDQAVYAYSLEDQQFWASELASELSFELRPGSFGENLTTQGIDLSTAVIGERWQIGQTVLEVSAPRIPCSTFAAFWRVNKLVKRFIAAARPGAYLRVLTPGVVQAGEEIAVVSRPEHGVTIRETFAAMSGQHELARRLLEAPQLPEAIRNDAAKWLAQTASVSSWSTAR